MKPINSGAYRKSLVCGVASLSLMCGAALAQENVSDPDTEDDAVLDTVVVVGTSFRSESDNTATKLQTPLSETAGSVTVYDDSFLDDIGSGDILDAIAYVPGVDILASEQGNFASITARGFGVPQTNGVRVNGAPTGGLALFDEGAVQRLEYVKGAQAVAYGEISAGGFVNLALKEASETERGGDLQLLADSFNTIRGDVTYGGPITEDGRLRGLFNFSRETSDEWYEFGDRDSSAYYLNLAADLTDRLTLTTYFYHNDYEYTRKQGLPVGEDLTDPLNPVYSVFEYDKNFFSGFENNNVNTLATFAQGKLDFEINETMSLSAIYSHSKLDEAFEIGEPAGFGYGQFVDATPGSPTFGTTNLDVFSFDRDSQTDYAELRLQGKHDITQNAVLNYYVSTEYTNFEREFNSYILDFTGFDSTFNVLNTNRGNPNPFGNKVPENDPFILDNRVYSISGTASLDLYERLRLNAGIRYDDRRGRNNLTSDNPEVAENEFTSYSLSAVYDLTDTVSAYYAYSEGFEYLIQFDCNGNALEPEENESHEIGVKWEPSAGLLVSAAAFENKSFNRPQGVLCPDGSFAGGGATASVNDDTNPQFGEGVEIEFIGQINDHWNIAGGLTYLDDGVENTNLSFSSPEYTASVFTRYDFLDGPLRDFGLGLGVTAEAGRPVDFGTTIAVPINLDDVADFDPDVDPSREFSFSAREGGPELGDYFIVDLAAYYQLSDNANLSLNVNNAFDEEYYSTLTLAFFNVTRQAPRQVSLRLDLAF